MQTDKGHTDKEIMGCLCLYRGLEISAISVTLRITSLNEKLWLMFLMRYAFKDYGDLQIRHAETVDLPA